LRADRHENRGFDGSMGRVQEARARTGLGAFRNDFKEGLGQTLR